jgi:hypothetical protein
VQSQETFRNQRRIQQIQQEDARFQARFDLTQALPEGQRGAAQRILEQQISQSLGARNIDELVGRGLREVDNVLQQEGLNIRRRSSQLERDFGARDNNLQRALQNSGRDDPRIRRLQRQAEVDFRSEFGRDQDTIGAAQNNRRRRSRGQGLDINAFDRAAISQRDNTQFAIQGLAGLFAASGQTAQIRGISEQNGPANTVDVNVAAGAFVINTSGDPAEIEAALNNKIGRIFTEASTRLQQENSALPQAASSRE